jgi:two-component system, sensor histidine kinase ChiS
MTDVLIVDDEPEVRAFLVELVVGEGRSVAAASDGLTALNLIDDGLRPQLVITDLRMPALSGVELAAAIRARFRDEGPAVALISADHRWLEDVEGVVAKLPKPFPVDSVADLIKQYCKPA